MFYSKNDATKTPVKIHYTCNVENLIPKPDMFLSKNWVSGELKILINNIKNFASMEKTFIFKSRIMFLTKSIIWQPSL